MKFLYTFVIVVFQLLLSLNSYALDFEQGTKVEFAAITQAQEILSTHDDFIKALSPFDRASRMKTSRSIELSEFINFISSQALPWSSQEQKKIENALVQINQKLSKFSLQFPKTIYLIKTSGKEEGDASYTRNRNAIIIPKIKLKGTTEELLAILTHELFHIYSHNHKDFQNTLYSVIGFHNCNNISFPQLLQSRKITNPDAPENSHYIDVTFNGQSISVVPILFSKEQVYNETLGGDFFDYLVLQFLVVTKVHETWQPVESLGRPAIVGLNSIAGYFEQVGWNTQYIIHPEEILADNFTILILGNQQEIKSPELLAKMESVLSAL